MNDPPRIASLLAAGTEILYGLGLSEQVVAVSHECDWPPDACDKPRVTFSAVAASASSKAIDDQVREILSTGQPLYGIDEEVLVALAPDLIVTQAQCDVCAVRYEDVLSLVESRLELRGARVVALNPQSLSDVFGDIQRIARAAGCAAAESYVESLRQRVEGVRRRTCGLRLDQRPPVACVEWVEPMMLAGTWVPELIDIAGGTCELVKPGLHSPYVPWQEVVRFDPGIIVIAACGFDLARTVQEAETLRKLPGWTDLTAVRSGRVFAVDGNAYFNRNGPRLVDSLELLAHLAQPDLFEAPDLGREQAWAAFS